MKNTFKKITSMGLAALMAATLCVNASAESLNYTANANVMAMPYSVSAKASSFTNTFTPRTKLYPNTGKYVDSAHYIYNLKYKKAKATPYFTITIPANSGSGTITVEYDLVHQGQVKYKEAKKIAFKNSSSKQTYYLSKTTSPCFAVYGSKNTDTYVRFKAASTNSKINKTAISASLDVKYY